MSPAPDATVEWIAERALPINTIELGGDFDDLMPLKDLFADARVVGLGEGTHGTRDYYQAQARLIDFLVKECGFTAVAFEASLADTVPLDRWVQGDGEDTLAEAGRRVSGMLYYTWNTPTVRELAIWMRDENDRRREADEPLLRWYGYDVQFPESAAARLKGLLTKANSPLAARVDEVMALVEQAPPMAVNFDGSRPESDVSVADTVEATGELLDAVKAAEAELAKTLGPADAARVVRTAQSLHDGRLVANTETITERYVVRDRAMADHVAWLLDREPDLKLILWAHNGHITKQHIRPQFRTMGDFLAERFGDDYVAVGQASATGTYYGTGKVGMGAVPLQPPPAGSLEETMQRAADRLDVGRFALVLPETDATGPAAWLAQPLAFRAIGTGYFENQFSQNNPAESFDVLLFHETTEADTQLPRNTFDLPLPVDPDQP